MAMYELILQRYPCRLIPKLPPTKIAAMVVGVKSGLVGERRRALKRWLSILVNHPVVSMDPVLQVLKNNTKKTMEVKKYNIVSLYFKRKLRYQMTSSTTLP